MVYINVSLRLQLALALLADAIDLSLGIVFIALHSA